MNRPYTVGLALALALNGLSCVPLSGGPSDISAPSDTKLCDAIAAAASCTEGEAECREVLCGPFYQPSACALDEKLATAEASAWAELEAVEEVVTEVNEEGEGWILCPVYDCDEGEGPILATCYDAANR